MLLAMSQVNDQRVPIPRDAEDDYTEAMARRRREFVAERTGAKLDHVGQHSVSPTQVAGNIETFFGSVTTAADVTAWLRRADRPLAGRSCSRCSRARPPQPGRSA